MSNPKPSGEHAKELALFGKVTAGLSHEINNSFATVGELCGLLEDLLAADDEIIPRDRLSTVVTKISHHVHRGTRQVELLNRFAHSVDRRRGAIDLHELLSLVVRVSERQARLRCVELALSEPDARLRLEGRPFEFIRLFHEVICLALETAKSGSGVTVGIVEGSDRWALEIDASETEDSRPATQQIGAGLPQLSRLAERLDAKLVCEFTPGRGLELRVILPSVLDTEGEEGDQR